MNPTQPSYGYFPQDPSRLAHPDEPPDARWDCLALCFDVMGSTLLTQRRDWHYEGDPYQAVQTKFLNQVIYNRNIIPVPDMVLPQGDGFFLLYDLARWERPRDGCLRVLREILFMERLYTQKQPNVTVYGVEAYRGRMGVARGNVKVLKSPSQRGGDWLAPVGEPLYLAARLQKEAPDRGALIHENVRVRSGDLDSLMDDQGYKLDGWKCTQESYSLNGFEAEQKAWRIGPDSPSGEGEP